MNEALGQHVMARTRWWMIAGVVIVVGCHTADRQTQRVDFSALRSADRVDVRESPNRVVAVLRDRDKIQAAAECIEQERDGWSERLTGPIAPDVMFNFYRGDRHLGAFGISTSYLTTGLTLSKEVPAEKIEALTRRLV